jgi:hypothetical protein
MTMCYDSCKDIGNCPSPSIILLHICNLGSTVFAWSISSWIIHRNSSFDCINFVFQIWYKFLDDYWCKICFFNFTSYFKASLLFFPNLDIKSLRDSQIVHFINTNPRFHTSTFKWCIFLNPLIIDWKIPPMFNSLLFANHKLQKTKEILAFPH